MAAEIANLRARLDAWRAAGTDRVDPVGFHRLEALARRCESADASMQALLQPRIDALAEAHAVAIARKPAASPAACGHARPLAALVAECEARRGNGIDVDDGNVGAALPAVEHPQLPALQPARQLWKAVRTERQLRQSLQKPHEDTGPLNSAQLVNRMLLRMGEAAPGYLEQLIGYVDVLSELEHLLGPVAVIESAMPSPGRKPAAKRARAPRRRKD
ncbi:MAG TPA: DUF2894 domain-containing protein [Thermomonas sp.]|nr:DUF2894 domain-containing protein [Thermomonas sp.]